MAAATTRLDGVVRQCFWLKIFPRWEGRDKTFVACGAACGGGRGGGMSDTDRPNHRQCPFGSWNRVSNSLHGRIGWLCLARESRPLEGLKIHFLFSSLVFEDLLGSWQQRRRRRRRLGIDFSLLQQHKQALPNQTPSLHWDFTTCEPGRQKRLFSVPTKVAHFRFT